MASLLRRRIFLPLFCAVVATAAAAGPNSEARPPGTAEPGLAPAVDELIQEAIGMAPSLASAEKRIEAARALVLPAGALPDPMIELMLQDVGLPNWTIGSEPMSMIGPEVRQGLLYPGKRKARQEVAEAGVAIRSAERQIILRRITAGIRTLYSRLFALDEEARAIDAARELLEMLTATVNSRYATGESGQEAVIKSQLAAARLDERAVDLKADRAGTVAALNALLDRPAEMPLGRVAGLPYVASSGSPWSDDAAKQAAQVLLRRAQAAEGERLLEAARLETKPNLFVSAGLGLRGGLDPVATLRVGLELPLWRKRKQQQLVVAAEAELAAARADLDAAVADAAAQAQALAAAWDRDTRQIVLYRESIIPRTSAAIDAARSEYLAGKGDFSAVIENFNFWLEARTELTRRASSRYATWAQAQALIGSAAAVPERDTP